MTNLRELEKKYEELGEEIEKLKKEQDVDISKDPIFLLSTEEYGKYEHKIPCVNTWWWLRSPGEISGDVAIVNNSGLISGLGIGVKYGGNAVRPAVRLDRCFKYDKNKIIYCGVTWVQIDKDLYIAEVPITFRRFDKKSNNYATSEIRKFLLDWYEERVGWK